MNRLLRPLRTLRPDIVMSDIRDPGALQKYIEDADQRNFLIQEGVEGIRSDFFQLSNYFSQEFRNLQENVIKEVSRVSMGSIVSSQKRERSPGHGRLIEDHRGGTRADIRELQGALEAAVKERDTEKSAKSHHQRE